MATVNTTAIQELYVAYFNRPADAAGLAYWETVVAAANGDTTAVSAAFAGSAEYEAEYGDLSNAQVVNQIYVNLFGRNAEPDGIAYWANLLTSGAVTVDAAVTAIAGGAQGTDDVAFTSKVTVATAFTEALDTQAEKDGYTGDLANAAAKEFLADIKTAADVTAALVPAALNASVTAVITAAPAFTLANGLEALTAANTAKADFLADALDVDAVADEIALTAVDPDEPTDAEIEAAIAAVEGDAGVAVDAVVAGYSAATTAVRAAKLALEEAENAEALATAEAALATAQDAVDEMAGLAAAVLDLEVATENDADATEAAALATVAVTTAQSTFNVKNVGDLATADAGVTYTSTAVVVASYDADDDEYSIPDAVDAADYPGLTEFVAAKNAEITANNAATAAAEALVLATANVNYMDAAASSEDELEAVAEAFVFQTPAIEDKPSAQEIAAEEEQFAEMLADLDEAADAATPLDTYADVLTDLSAALTAAADATAIKALTATAVTNGYITTADKTAIDAGANGAAAAALLADNNWQARSDALDTAVAALVVVEGAAANTLVLALTAAEGAVETAETAIETLADAIAAFNETEELVAGLEDADAAIADALAAFDENDFADPIIVTGIKFGTAADDVFLAGTADGTIKNFGALGSDDSLYIGTGFTVNTNDLEDGSNSVLEVFINADGADTVISIETSLFGSNAATPEVIEIILTGVAAADVSLANGFITVA